MDREEEKLIKAVKVIELMHHRNTNQHRRSPWFRWLAVLRRNLSKVVLDLSGGSRTALSARMDFLNNGILPPCYW